MFKNKWLMLVILSSLSFNFKPSEIHTPFDQNPLHIAVQAGLTDAVKTLVDAGADINATDHDGRTPLHMAAKLGNAKIVKILLDAKADPNTGDDNGKTPLHIAALEGNTDTIKTLLDAGANINAKNNFDATPLNVATFARQLDAVKTLVDAGADINATDNNGRTPLHMAAKLGNAKIVKTLLDAKADPNALDLSKFSPLHYGFYPETAKILLDYGADRTIKNSNNLTPLEYQRSQTYHPELSKIEDEYLKYQHTPEAQKLRGSLFEQTLKHLLQKSTDLKFSELPLGLRQKIKTLYTPEYAQKIENYLQRQEVQVEKNNFIRSARFGKLAESSVYAQNRYNHAI